MTKIFINPGHDTTYDNGAVNADGTRECDIALSIGQLTQKYLMAAGITTKLLQSDNLCHDSDHDLPCVCDEANEWHPDAFISIHCNAANTQARGAEVEVFEDSGFAGKLAHAIQDQIVGSIGTVDRGVKEMPELIVLHDVSAPAILIETAFIDNDDDCELLRSRMDDFARAIARGVTDALSK